MGGWVQDLRQAMRAMAKAPGLSAAIILTLAVGLGANAAIFSLVRQVLLAPLPYAEPERIVTVAGNPWIPVALFEEIRHTEGGVFEEVAAYYPQRFAVTGGEEPVEVEGVRVTPNFFRIFPVRAVRDLGFTTGEAEPGTVLLSEGFRPGEAPEGLTLDGLHHRVAGDSRPALLVLRQGAVGLLLLVACANAANLLLARLASRRRELALRSALGATPTRLARQLLAECLALALMGGLCASLFMRLFLGTILALAPKDLPRLGEVAMDGPFFLFILALSLLAGLLFGLLPALLGGRRPLFEHLKEGARATGGAKGGPRMRQALLVAQVAITLMLLAGAGLLGRSFLSLATRPPGFRTAGVLAIPLTLPETRIATVPELEAFQPVPEIAPLDRFLEEERGPYRFRALLLGSFAALALSSLLFGVGGRDPWTLAGATACILLIAATACLLPARREALAPPLEHP